MKNWLCLQNDPAWIGTIDRKYFRFLNFTVTTFDFKFAHLNDSDLCAAANGATTDTATANTTAGTTEFTSEFISQTAKVT